MSKPRPPFLDRMDHETAQLQDRIDLAMKAIENRPEQMDDEAYRLLIQQHAHMVAYQCVLLQRIKLAERSL